MSQYKRTEIKIESYNPQEIVLNYDESEIRKEYSRLRKVALKRLARLENNPDFEAPAYAKFHKHEWQTLGELGNVASIAKALSSINRFIDLKGSLITEQQRMRRERREALEETIGRKFKNYKEMQLFDDFLEYLQAKYNDQFHYDIEDVNKLFDNYADEVLDGAMSLEEFVDTYENYTSLVKIVHK